MAGHPPSPAAPWGSPALLHVHRAERSDGLVSGLADLLAEPLQDALATEVVAVYSRGIERWIAQELSTRLGTGPLGRDGVAANLAFPFPGKLIRTAVAKGSNIEPDEDPWLPARLTWPMLELIDEGRDAGMLGPLAAHVGAGEASATDEDPLARRFGSVRHVADLFDRYAVERPDMILRWAEGHATGPEGDTLEERHRWQPRLWSAVHDRLDVPSFAERHAAACAALRADPDLVDLPSRLSLFGLTSLPATFVAVLHALAEHRDVHLFLLHPSPVLWRRIEEAVPDRHLRVRDADPSRDLPYHPLLRAWGRDARELQFAVPEADRWHVVDDDHAEPDTLLRRLQHDVRSDAAPGTGDERLILAPGDRSVQVHDCHGRLRQVEVLRDAVLHLLADDPTLEPRDVIVMCPDIEAFAPLVTAVFGAEAVAHDGTAGPPEPDAPPSLRVRLADRSLRRTNPVLEVVSQVLDLVDDRVSASAVLDLVSREPVRRRFGFDDEELDLLESWIAELQIRWGLDARHRARHGLPPIDANSWRAGLERLLLGMTMADEDLRLIDRDGDATDVLPQVAPYDGVEGKDNDLAGRLVELLHRLGTALEAMDHARTIDAWRDAIGAAADALSATDSDTGWQRAQLNRVLEELVEEATVGTATSPVELSLAEVRVLLAQRLAGRPSRTSHRTGDLTVSTLVPMRSVPHRVVCLLGLDDGAFPRQAVLDSDDLLLDAPRMGDRDARSEDRQLLLDALMAATDHLVVTFAGRDVRTNEARPPAVPVDELLDVIDRTVAADRSTDTEVRPRDRVTIRHPLVEHDWRNFVPGRLVGDGRPWGFLPASLAAAEAQRGQTRPARVFLTDPLPATGDDVIELDHLVAFLEHPVRAFVTQRLELRLPGDRDRPSDAIPSSLDGLEEWKVGQELLDTWLAGGDPDLVPPMLRARGQVPPGGMSDADLARIHDRASAVADQAEKVGLAPGPRRTVDLEVELPDGRLLRGAVPGVGGWCIETVTYSKLKPKHRLASWARYLAAVAAMPDEPWRAAVVARPDWGRYSAKAMVLDGLAGDDPAVAVTKALQALVDLYDRGMRAPLPLYCETSAKIAENISRDNLPEQYLNFPWATGPYSPFASEDLDPYHLLVLGGQRTYDELLDERCIDPAEAGWHPTDDRRLVAYAWRLWEPVIANEHKSVRRP